MGAPAETVQQQAENPKASLGVRLMKGLLKAAFYATVYPVVVYPHRLAYKAAKTGIDLSDTWKGKTASVLGGAVLSASFAAVQLYGGTYAFVAAGDTPVAWDRGSHTGYITRLSNKGVWPCNTWEVELGTLGQRGRKGGTVPTDFAFSSSIRRFNPGTIEKLQKAQANGELVELNHRQSFFNERAFDSFPFSCIQRTPYQIADMHVIADKPQGSDESIQTHPGERGSAAEQRATPSPRR